VSTFDVKHRVALHASLNSSSTSKARPATGTNMRQFQTVDGVSGYTQHVFHARL
jgi:hypothetical protein